MTDYELIDFQPLLDLSADEVVTHSYANDVTLSTGKTLVLITLDNDIDHTRPNTLGPNSLYELGVQLDQAKQRAARGEISGVALTGKPHILAAGADLSKVSDLDSHESALLMAQLGHHVLGKLATLGVPSFVFINGLALGGGLEIALHADFRSVSEAASAVALPEVFLGLVPGWGGAYLLPHLIGIESALKVIIENPLKNNRMLSAQQVADLGIADTIFPSVRFLEQSIEWASEVIDGTLTVKRPHAPGKIERLVKWDAAVAVARKSVESKIGTVALAPYRALDLIKSAKSGSREEAFEREDEALAHLIAGDQFRASIYAFDLVQKRAKKPAGAPDKKLAQTISKVGIVGAGLMASQFAVLFARRLQVPVVITDLDQGRIDRGIDLIRADIAALHTKGRISADESQRLTGLVSGTVNTADFADCDWVIEAVFEELAVKQDVLTEVEKHLSASAVLATNTSSLSVDKIGARLKHPERLIGFHFFNPVAVMPLVEVVRAQRTSEATVATALNVASKLKKTAVITSDSPGFVVNRLLAKLLGEAMFAVDSGTHLSDVDRALAPLGLPMPPSALLDLVGLTVGAHVLDSHAEAFPDRFYRSENLHKVAEYGKLLDRDAQGKVRGFDKRALDLLSGGTSPLPADEILRRVEDGLADEIHRMLDANVVHAAQDIDLCMVLGAGWPFQMGGITPYLDRVGASRRVNRQPFHSPEIRGVTD